MSEERIRAEVFGFSDEQLLEKLVELGEEDAGPIMDTTRSAYQKMLIRKLLGREFVPADPGAVTDDEDAGDEDDDLGYDEEDDDAEEVDSGLRQRHQGGESDMTGESPTSGQVAQSRPNIFITFLKMVVIGVFAVTLLVVFTSKQ